MKAIDFIKDSKNEFTQKEIVVKGNNNKEYKVKINNKLKDTDVMSMVDDLVSRSEMCKKENIKFDTVMSMYALMIKYFTDIQFSTYPNLKRQFAHEIDMLKAMIDLGVFTEILSNFDNGEIKKIEDMFKKYATSFNVINHNEITKQILAGEGNGELPV